jgi:hypothetical protein
MEIARTATILPACLGSAVKKEGKTGKNGSANAPVQPPTHPANQ